MTLTQLLSLLEENPSSVDFSQCMACIDAFYLFTPTRFSNGNQHNDAGQNNGSCKIFAFGLLQDLTEAQALACFGKYYREDVLLNPNGSNHQNIRQFIVSGWAGIHFSGQALKARL